MRQGKNEDRTFGFITGHVYQQKITSTRVAVIDKQQCLSSSADGFGKTSLGYFRFLRGFYASGWFVPLVGN